jgi:hypothetical protein
VKNMEQRIVSMEQELKALKERRSKTEAKRKRDEAIKSKKESARRIALTGTMILEKVHSGEMEETQFRTWLDGRLTDSVDRALFGL